MGSVIKRLILLVAVLSLAAPGLARAETTWYHPSAATPFDLGPEGGGGAHQFPFTGDEVPIPTATVQRDATTGDATAMQHNLLGISGGLGCIASSPFTTFEVTHEGPVRWVTVTYGNALVSPYSYIKASVIDEDGIFAKTVNVRGLVLGSGLVRLGPLDLDGPVTARFGLEVTSSCPSLDLASARFTGVAFTS